MKTTSLGENHQRKLLVNSFTKKLSGKLITKGLISSQTKSSKNQSEVISSVSKTLSMKSWLSESNSNKSKTSFTPSNSQLLKVFWFQDWENPFPKMDIGVTEEKKLTNILKLWSDLFFFYIYSAFFFYYKAIALTIY